MRRGWLRKGRDAENAKLRSRCGLRMRGSRQQKAAENVAGGDFGSSGRTRTYNPSVNSRMLYH